MRVDELQRELHAEIDTVPAPPALIAPVIRRARRRTAIRRTAVGVAAALVAAAVVVPVALSDHNDETRVTTSPAPLNLATARWIVHSKSSAGLGSGTSQSAVATAGRTLLVAGSRPVGPQQSPQAAIWYSTDATTWQRAEMPAAGGGVNAIAAAGNRALAIGTDRSGLFSYVWVSNDHGRRWSARVHGSQVFGAPAPEMGRPFVQTVQHLHGRWIASGGSSSGWAGVWVSTTGARWHQVLDSKPAQVAGSIDVTPIRRDRLFGYWINQGWYSTTGTAWTGPVTLAVPAGIGLRTVAPGASVAFGDPVEVHGQPTPLLRSRDEGRTWAEDPAFLDTFPSAIVNTVGVHNGLWVASGTSGQPNRPDAWISQDLHRWRHLPAALRGTPGGTLSLIATHQNTIVLLGTAPELDRFYTLRP